jgi:integrase
MSVRPWWRKQNRAWYAFVGGRQRLLCHAPTKTDAGGRDQAMQEFAKALLAGSTAVDAIQPILIGIIQAFLDWSKAHNAPKTYRGYRDFLKGFLACVDVLYADDLRPFHVTRWLAAHSAWGPAGQRAAITAVKRCLNWARDEELIERNPLSKVQKPAPVRREVLIAAEDHARMLDASDDAFRDVLTALYSLGCRPIEVRMVTAREVDLDQGVWIFPVGHPACKGGRRIRRPKVTYLTPAMLNLTRRLIERYPEGPLFRNSRGDPWKGAAFKDRLRRLREKLKLPAGTCAYSYRHTFATDGLEKGIDVATVAELLGHSNLTMLSEVYGHLTQRAQHLHAAVEQLRDPAKGNADQGRAVEHKTPGAEPEDPDPGTR